jgi:hypothetical protein
MGQFVLHLARCKHKSNFALLSHGLCSILSTQLFEIDPVVLWAVTLS